MKKQFPQFYDFFPETFILPYDRMKVLKAFSGKRRPVFILKPEFCAEGRGIRLVKKLDDIDLNANMICQKYLK